MTELVQPTPKFTPDELNIIEYCLANYAQYFADNDDYDSVIGLLDKVQSLTSAPCRLERQGGTLLDNCHA